MKALLSTIAAVLLASSATAIYLDSPITESHDSSLDMPIAPITTFTLPDTVATLTSYSDARPIDVDTIDGISTDTTVDASKRENGIVPLELVNDRLRKKIDQDLYRFKTINFDLAAATGIQPGGIGDSTAVSTTSPISQDNLSSVTPTSSVPRVLSANIVLPTFAIKITEDPNVSDIDTVISIASFINSLPESTRLAPIFGAADIARTNQQGIDTATGSVESLVAPTPMSDRNPAVSAIQRHQITLDEMDLLSILHIQNMASVFTSSAPVAASRGFKAQTSILSRGSDNPYVFAPPSLPVLSLPPSSLRPQPTGLINAPSRSWAAPEPRPMDTMYPALSQPGRQHKDMFTGVPPDPAIPGFIDAPVVTPATGTLAISSPRILATSRQPQKLQYPLPTILSMAPPQQQQMAVPPLLHSLAPPSALQLVIPSEMASVSLQTAPQQQMLTVLLRPTHAPTPAFESMLSINMLTSTPPINIPPAMLVDSSSQYNTPIIPFISNGSRLPVPTPQEKQSSSGKGDVNASGIASILQNVFHIPPSAITIDGKPVFNDGAVISGHKAGDSIIIVGGKGLINPKHNKGGDGDDDDDEDGDQDAESDTETTTHMLDVDRARNHRRVSSKTIHLDSNSKSSTDAVSGSDSDGSDGSDDGSDSDSDSNDSVESSSATSNSLLTTTTTSRTMSSGVSSSVESTTATSIKSSSSSATNVIPSPQAEQLSPSSSLPSSSASQLLPTPTSSSIKPVSESTTENESVNSLLSLAKLLSA
ncbi:hypothetical protein BX070DRAFT_221489 [Coemansia spiralis]|nr:hypothetical protein BX070DRAFT_221489 [Coemansia spiralis]